MTDEGVVYLVGAGPGDPELITVRGLKCIRMADAIIYDRLVNDALLEEAPSWAERIFAGKAAGRHTMRQETINAVMVERARSGMTVVRLKGGDPFVFGRGGEEALACAKAGIRWEVVPGITSAVGVPTSAGIPLTHRGVSGSFAVTSAHRAGDQEADWAALAQMDTLVVLMGVASLEQVAAALMRHGRSARTPVAIIERGTEPDERVLVGTLETIAKRARERCLSPPATIVVGDVVLVREAGVCGRWDSSEGEEAVPSLAHARTGPVPAVS